MKRLQPIMKFTHIMLLVISIVLSACQSTGNSGFGTAGTTGAPKVAILLPLSGSNAALGKNLLNAAQMAVFQEAGPDFELIVKDTNQNGGALAALQQAIDEGARLVLGPIFANQVREIMPLAASKGVQILSFSNDESLAKEGVFVGGLTLSQQINRIFHYVSTQDIKRLALLLPENNYGRVVESAAVQYASAWGLEVFQTEFYDPSSKNFSETVRKLGPGDPVPLASTEEEINQQNDPTGDLEQPEYQEQDTVDDVVVSSETPPAWMPPYKPIKVVNYQALLIAEGGERLITLSALAPYHGIDTSQVRLLGTNLWDDPALQREASLLGGWYPNYANQEKQLFEQRYRQLFGVQPNRLASNVYDMVTLAAKLGDKPGANFGRNAIINFGELSGKNGVFRFMPNGVAEYGLAIYEVQRQRILLKDPAPTTLLPLIN